MSKDWASHPLASLTKKIGSGATPRGGSAVYIAQGTAFIRSQNVYDFRFDPTGLAYITEQAATELKNVTVNPEDVLLNITGDSVARVCIAPKVPSRVSQHVAIIRPDPAKLDTRFLLYSLINPNAKLRLMNLASAGATRKALTKQHLESFEIDIPPIMEQRRIASALGALDELIEENRKLMEQILNFSRSRFSSLVRHDTPRVRLDTIAEINPSRAQRAEDTEVIYLAIADVKDGSVSWPTPVIWSEAPVASRLLSQKGDVIWSRVRPNRRSHALLPETSHQVVVSTGMVVIRPKKVSSAYLMAVCDSEFFSDRLAAITGGTAYPTVDAVDFANVEVPLFGEGVRDLFDATMSPLWDVFGALEEEIRELVKTRDELLPWLISGHVRLKEVV
jgi:type I restriction enzyme S subunit